MSADKKLIVGLGEILWDLLPTGKKLGGAPANFAYHSAMLGNRGVPVSRVGDDELGTEIEEVLKDLLLSVEGLQIDPTHPTGTVDVEIDSLGQPSYLIVENVAWDHLEWTDALQRLAVAADAVCFGSLAQRARGSRETIRRFLHASRADAVRFFDINIRQHYCSMEVLETSLELANIVKLNDEEMVRVADLLGLGAKGDLNAARSLLAKYNLDLVCVTCGANGSWLVAPYGEDIHPGVEITVADAIGAGDAFSAALCHHFLKGSDLATTNAAANRLGSWVASQTGATPRPDDKVLSGVI